MLKSELEKFREDSIKNAKRGIDTLYPKSYGDIFVEDYNKVLKILRDIAGVEEPKEKE